MLGALKQLRVFFVSILGCLFIFCGDGRAQVLMSELPGDGGAPQISMDRYLTPTLHSLDCMRSSTGLIADAVFVDRQLSSSCPLVLANLQTSPTNIALDLILLMEQKQWETLQGLMNTLEKLPYHFSTGLFFNRYDMNHPDRVTDYYVSSVDNVHLVLALWVLGEQKIRRFSLSERAKKLGRRFNWTEMIDPNSGLARGGLAFDGNRFIPANWFFSHGGSEARSIYSVGYAIGFLKNKIPAKNISWEFHRDPKFGSMMRTWDGGVFQMLLPELLIRESRYSKVLDESFRNFSRWALARSEGALLPVLHSASQIGPFDRLGWQQNYCGGDQPCYLGKAGHRELISHQNDDRYRSELAGLWERASTLHAVFLAALFQRSEYASWLRRAEPLASEGNPLYHSQLGWMDSYHVQGPHRFKVVPMLLSLDQGMAALSLVRMQSRDNDNIVSRTLFRNRKARERLAEIYSDWESYWRRGGLYGR